MKMRYDGTLLRRNADAGERDYVEHGTGPDTHRDDVQRVEAQRITCIGQEVAAELGAIG